MEKEPGVGVLGASGVEVGFFVDFAVSGRWVGWVSRMDIVVVQVRDTTFSKAGDLGSVPLPFAYTSYDA